MGGKKYKIPFFLSDKKSFIKAIHWLLWLLYENNTQNFSIKLINEFFKIINNTSLLLKRRNDYHFLAFENKTYLRFLRHLI